MKIRIHWAGPRIVKSKCGFDIIELPVMQKIRRDETVTVDVEEGQRIVMRSQHTYLGISLSDGYIVLQAEAEAPVIRVIAPYSSWIEGNLKVIERSGKFQVKEQGVVEYKRRIWK